MAQADRRSAGEPVFKVGDVVGPYTILAHLRTGGMAALYLARRRGAAGFQRLVAIKVILPHHARDEQLVRMFVDEATITARIDHPNVVHVEDLGEIRGTYFLVMEYVHGRSLGQLLDVLGEKHRRPSPLVAVAIAARIAEGLHAAHETTDEAGHLVNLVHRDVSPQNILLSHKGHVKLIDFGVAKARLRREETAVASLKGKVRYMAPEQATTGKVDRRSDVYSLGIVLWEMLTMRQLFAGQSEFDVLLKVRDPQVPPPSRFVSEIPHELDHVVMAALARDPLRRPENAKIFRRMLARALPRSMVLDSAHLADLMLSLVGDELRDFNAALPKDVSVAFDAEQKRASIHDAEDADESDPMTLQSDKFRFEAERARDSVDATRAMRVPSAVGADVGRPEATTPGSPVAKARTGISLDGAEPAGPTGPTEPHRAVDGDEPQPPPTKPLDLNQIRSGAEAVSETGETSVSGRRRRSALGWVALMLVALAVVLGLVVTEVYPESLPFIPRVLPGLRPSRESTPPAARGGEAPVRPRAAGPHSASGPTDPSAQGVSRPVAGEPRATEPYSPSPTAEGAAAKVARRHPRRGRRRRARHRRRSR